MSGAVYPLKGQQREAVDPRDSVWLSASAGTGKTQVLSARVLRLLLQPGVDPSQILCLTFTKAGAAEMAVRINSVLARWVRLPDTDLFEELGRLGAPREPDDRARARTLFASVLDCPGGGLRIDTIHAFSQWLLANFPSEAELIPGARPMEDRERELLARDVLGDMLVEAEHGGDRRLLDSVQKFVRRKNGEALKAWLMRCARSHDLWFGKRAWQPPMRAQVLQMLGLPSDANGAWAADALSPEIFPDHQLLAMLPTLDGWNAKTGQEAAAFIRHWLAMDMAARVDAFPMFFDTILKKDGTPRTMKKPSDSDPLFVARQEEIAQSAALYHERRSLLDLADFLVPALELGRAFALRWDAAKTREGLLDFDDLIERAAALLNDQAAGDWIRFKLDRQFNHILVDEAQDTNAAQWRIIGGLIDDFFAGEGASGAALRTIFTVGDYKQAIFGFQGTSPENFEAARNRVRDAMLGAATSADGVRATAEARQLRELDLDQSFRTARPVLEFVDQAVEAIGPESLGLSAYKHHEGQDRPGLVTLWEPVNDTRGKADDDGEESWLAKHDRAMADKIAEQVRRWTSGVEPFALAKGEHRNARAGDIMVLVRKRRDLAALIVARLHAKGVPVAGVDRLRLGAPLVVKDLMAALRFAAQPLDDLNLANLLSSPLVGWSQDDLLTHVPREDGARLWHHLRRSDDAFVAATVARLRDLLARADFDTPEALLHWMLVGPWHGRANLLARLGREAADPIDELVNAAFAYEALHTPSLAGFIQWFDAGDGELKRDAGETPDLVRVMTVHGSKGLQAPIVILADATGKPGDGGDLELPEMVAGDGQVRSVPLPGLKSEERAGPVADAHDMASAASLQEHWRLMYVAMTRAEEALFIGGSLGPRDKDGPHEDSWYARLDPLFGGDKLADDLWGGRREFGTRAAPVSTSLPGAQASPTDIPEWLSRPIGPEPRPPRPLAPSSAGEDQGADPPLPPDQAREAARRGMLIHRLLERLPDVAQAERATAAEAWLARQAIDLDQGQRDEIAQRAISVISDPEFSELFSPASLAEVPLAATVGGEVIAGIADRLLVTAEEITVIDFKTARRPPVDIASVPQPTLRQMAAYIAALEAIYPGRRVRAGLLYTQTPQLITVPDDRIAPFKAAFVAD